MNYFQSTDEQKLIYSGQLLGDSVVLKDILRQYEGQETHTVHLVYTPKNRNYYNKPMSNQKSDTKSTNNAPSQPSVSNSSTTATSTDGLRYVPNEHKNSNGETFQKNNKIN